MVTECHVRTCVALIELESVDGNYAVSGEIISPTFYLNKHVLDRGRVPPTLLSFATKVNNIHTTNNTALQPSQSSTPDLHSTFHQEKMSAEDTQSQAGYEDGGGRGQGAPTPLSALEVRFLLEEG